MAQRVGAGGGQWSGASFVAGPGWGGRDRLPGDGMVWGDVRREGAGECPRGAGMGKGWFSWERKSLQMELGLVKPSSHPSPSLGRG